MEEYSKGSKEIELMNPIPLNKPETNQCGDSEMSLLPLHKLPDSSPGHRFKLVKSQTASRIDISSNGKEVIGSPTLNLLKKGTLNQPAQRQSFNSLSVSANRFDSMRMARRRSKKGAHRRKRKVVNTDRGWTCIRGIVKGSHRIYKVVDEIGKYGFPFHNDTATLHEFLKPALRQSEGAQDTEESYPFYLIHPNGVFKLIWSVILILLLLYTAFVTPLRVAFFDSESEDNLGWKVTEYLIDGLFGLDIIVNLLSMYYDSEDKLRQNLESQFPQCFFFQYTKKRLNSFELVQKIFNIQYNKVNQWIAKSGHQKILHFLNILCLYILIIIFLFQIIIVDINNIILLTYKIIEIINNAKYSIKQYHYNFL